MQFYEKVRLLRTANGISQTKMAKMLNISNSAYQHYEYGDREPRISTLISMAHIFDVTLDDLLCRDDWETAHAEPSDEY